MAGISSYGLHVAAYRLPHDEIARAWRSKSAKGEKAVACYDEDALTLACAAAQDLIAGTDPSKFGGLFFASTTSPYLEKSVSAFIAFVHRLGAGAITADFANSRRCASSAVLAAIDAVGSGRADEVIVAAGETRTVQPGSSLESVLGDGGAAVSIGQKDVLAEILASVSISDETYDEFRRSEAAYVNEGDPRFAASHTFAPTVARVTELLLEKAGQGREGIAHIALGAGNPRGVKAAVKAAGLDAQKLVPPYLDKVGYLGAAQSLCTLAQALERAKPGEKILWISYGDGADAFLLEATGRVSDLPPSRVDAAVADRRPLETYEQYLKFRGVFDNSSPGPGETAVLHHNEHEWNLPLLAHECSGCGLVFYPPGPSCLRCGATEGHSRVPVPRRGEIFTYTTDFLAVNPDPPQITTVCTAENGARLFLQGTDFLPSGAEVGLPVEFQIRKLHDGADFPVYYWKARPASR